MVHVNHVCLAHINQRTIRWRFSTHAPAVVLLASMLKPHLLVLTRRPTAMVSHDCDGGEIKIWGFGVISIPLPPRSAPSPSPSFLSLIAILFVIVKCPLGYTSSETGCDACPADTYRDATSVQCIQCPTGISTNQLTGRTAAADCSHSKWDQQHCWLVWAENLELVELISSPFWIAMMRPPRNQGRIC